MLGGPSDTARSIVVSLATDWSGRILGGRYQLEARLGAGAMGEVYRGVLTSLGKPVAIKLLKPDMARDPELAARFVQEARIAATIRHEGIAEVFDFGVEDGVPFYVMELLSGVDLSARLALSGPLRAEQAVEIVAAAADAVGVAHAGGVVHRDLKPENIFLAPDGKGGEKVKVVDFGISKVLQPGAGLEKSTLTLPGVICGTPYYMSPEQASGKEVDLRTDVYSLGVVLYELLCGAPPFEANESVRVMAMHITDEPPAFAARRPGLLVPSELEAVVRKALAKRPDDRYPTMAELATALRATLGPRLAGASPATSGTLPAAVEPARAGTPSAAGGKGKLLFGAALLAAGLVAAALGIRAAQPARPVLEPVGPPPAREVRLSLASDPPGATVLLDGRSLGVTPATAPVPRGQAAVQLVFQLAGHEPESVEVVPDQDRSVAAQLAVAAPAAVLPLAGPAAGALAPPGPAPAARASRTKLAPRAPAAAPPPQAAGSGPAPAPVTPPAPAARPAPAPGPAAVDDLKPLGGG